MQNHSQKIVALLGPTNTGKTHVAIEKMQTRAIRAIKNSLYLKKNGRDFSIVDNYKTERSIFWGLTSLFFLGDVVYLLLRQLDVLR